MLNKYQLEFKKNIEKIASKGRYGRDVFGDNVSCIAYAMSNGCDLRSRAKREKAYMAIAGRYKKEEIELFAENYALLAEGLEFETKDFLGDIYAELEAANKKAGQYFTPFHVCDMMVRMGSGDFRQEVKKRIITVSEPCCGSGAMILPYAKLINELPQEERAAAQRNVFIFANDLDPLCVKMCYCQLSMLGLSAQITQGDALTMTVNDIFYTPTCFFTFDIPSLKIQLKEGGQSKDKEELLKLLDDDIFIVLEEAV